MCGRSMPFDMSSRKTFVWLTVVLVCARALFEAASGTQLGLLLIFSLSSLVFAFVLKWFMPFVLKTFSSPLNSDVAVNWLMFVSIVGLAALAGVKMAVF